MYKRQCTKFIKYISVSFQNLSLFNVNSYGDIDSKQFVILLAFMYKLGICKNSFNNFRFSIYFYYLHDINKTCSIFIKFRNGLLVLFPPNKLVSFLINENRQTVRFSMLRVVFLVRFLS